MTFVIPTKMKWTIACAFLSFAFVLHASAVLRPLFPFKPAPPSNGELVITGEELVLGPAKKPQLNDRGHVR